MVGRAVDRVTAFTDAAVAIALTLLVLPLVDIAHEAADTAVPTLLQEHAGDFFAFVLSYFVVVLFWRAHRRLYELVAHLDETLLTLNLLWLLGVVFLPVPTAVLTFESEEQGATVLYLSNLLFVALTSLAMSAWLWSHPRLYRTESIATLRHYLHRSLVACGAMAVIAVLGLLLGATALLLLAAVPAGQFLIERAARRSRGRGSVE